MSYCASIRMYVNPALRPGLDALLWWLMDHHYSRPAAESIVRHAGREGTPTGCPYLEAEDEDGATEAFVSALPAVPPDAAAWDDESVLFDARMLADGVHPMPFPPEPDGPGYVPTAADLEDYARWAAELDARRDREEFYRLHPLGEFNAVRPD
jgi:hypothetical protein